MRLTLLVHFFILKDTPSDDQAAPKPERERPESNRGFL